jgi:hypothetical protein
MTDADELMRTAVHEAAHAWAGWTWGRMPAVLSIRPGAAHSGVTLSDRSADQHLSKLIDGHHPLDGLDPAARRFADQRLVAVLIGEEAAELFMPRMGRQADPPGYIGDVRATLEAQSPPGGPVVPLSPERRERLAATEADADPWHDEEIAFEMAFRLVGMTANVYLVWVRAEARRLASDHAQAIYALAAALRASPNQVLDGSDAIAILEAQEQPV